MNTHCSSGAALSEGGKEGKIIKQEPCDAVESRTLRPRSCTQGALLQFFQLWDGFQVQKEEFPGVELKDPKNMDRGKNTHFRTPLRFKVPSLLQNSKGADWDWPLFPWCIPFASKVHPGFQGRSKSRSEVWSGGIFQAVVSWVAGARIPRDFLRNLLRSERPEYS